MIEFSINSYDVNLNYVFVFFSNHLLQEPTFLLQYGCITGYITAHELVSDFRVFSLPLYVESKETYKYGLWGKSFRYIS